MTSKLNIKDKLVDLYFNQPRVLYKHLFDSYRISYYNISGTDTSCFPYK